jgi:hypothetical protein
LKQQEEAGIMKTKQACEVRVLLNPWLDCFDSCRHDSADNNAHVSCVPGFGVERVMVKQAVVTVMAAA